MKKILLIAEYLLISVIVFATANAQIAAWNLTTATTTATTANSNITASSISVVPSTSILYQVSPGDIYCGTWSTSASFSTSGKYWEFSITANYGYEIVISSMTFKAGRTSAGPQKIQVQYSLDGFATSGTTALGETANPNTSTLDQFTLTSLPPATSGQITFRIWGYGATTTGNFRLNNIVINGNVNSTTSPGSGIGAASVSPYKWKYNEPTALRFVIKPAADTVNGIRIIKPDFLNWNTSAISISPDSLNGTQQQLGDTIQIANVNLRNQDSIVVTIADVQAIDTTNVFSVIVQTKKGESQYGRISLLPQMLIYGSPRPMSWVKTKNISGTHLYEGKYVVIQGVVTVANEFGGPAYVQDATAGIAVYDLSVFNTVNRGDEVKLLGVVSPYFGMYELNPCSVLETISEGNPVDTTVVTMPQINNQNQSGVEPYECRLVRVNNIAKVLTEAKSPATSWAVSGTGTIYLLVSGTDTIKVFVKPVNTIANMATPSGVFDMVGVLGQFSNVYELLPRTIDDIIVEGAGPRIISGVPYESNMTSNSITFNWLTDAPGTSIVNYGATTTYGSTFIDTNKVIQHSITVEGLTPATVYHVQIGTSNGAGTTYTNDYLVSTASQSSSGVINIYFSKSADNTLARGENAQTVNIYQKLIDRINIAKSTIDIALYSLSGDVGGYIASALSAAKTRGVQVRVIGEYDNRTTAPWTTLSNNSITPIFDNFDATNAGAGLMHNKFAVFDNNDDTDTNDWVWTGSWNATDPGNNNDAQNVIEIQDKALANAYTMEFNEMWGSSTATANASVSRFGARKLNNTPHYFIVNGTPIECYFSPSDGTSSQIIKTLSKANESVNFCMLSFTYSSTTSALTKLYNNGVKVRGVIDNRTDAGQQFDTLVARGMDVHLKASNIGLLHHKYAVVDANGADSNKYVITGSHNWSGSAETKNNENTLIIRSPRLANLYLQEFSKRYTDAGGSDILLGVVEKTGERPTEFNLSQNYPNPFNPMTNIELRIPNSGLVNLKVYDILGRHVATLMNEVKPAGIYNISWNASTLPSGVYFYQIQAGNYFGVKKALLLK